MDSPSGTNGGPTREEIAALPRVAQQVLALRAVARIRRVPNWHEQYGSEARAACEQVLRACSEPRSSDAFASAAVDLSLEIARSHAESDTGVSKVFAMALEAVREDLDSLRSLGDQVRSLEDWLGPA